MNKKNVRYNILIIIVYIIGIILISQLFNLQIIHGEQYLETSNTRLTRETTVKASRGNILDRNGNIIAGTVSKYEIDLYKSKIDTQTLNDTILKIINVLEKNEDTYIDKFPISVEPTIKFDYETEEKAKEWLLNNELDENLTATEVIKHYQEKYEIKNENIKEIRKIIGIRYGIEKEGYTTMKAYVISKDISKKSVSEFEEQSSSFPGVAISQYSQRIYTNGSLASHIIGYIGKINEEELAESEGYDLNDYIGKIGIEYVYEKYLKGTDGKKQTDMSVSGTTTGEYITSEAIAGDNVVLTIDANLQMVAEKALKDNIEKIANGGFGKVYDAKAGTAVVMNVKTGEILAMCSYPDYEPKEFIDGISVEKWNEYTEEGRSALLNRAMQSAYAPGSIFKMVTAIAGLETGQITTTEKINDTGVYPHGHNPVCWYWSSYRRGHGDINVSEAIKHSCNYFFYETCTRMGIEELERYAKYFGLGNKTNIELPGELSGTLAGKTLYEKLGKTWYYGNTLSASIGQAENNFTPLQMAKYISMLANGGNKIDVTVLKEITKQNGETEDLEEVEKYVNELLGLEEEETEDLNISEENIKAVLEGMKSVTTETGGTAYSVFKDFEIDVGGKTGSAEAGNKVNAWFAGFAPYDDPEIAIVVMVENGGHGYYTAEVVKEIIEEYFGLNEEITENTEAIKYTEQQNT